MSSKPPPLSYHRAGAAILGQRLSAPRRHVQVVAGPRQVGKTTLVEQALAASSLPSLFVSADDPTLRDPAWLSSQWERGRRLASESEHGAILAVDEVQKVGQWSDMVKTLWDEDTRARRLLRIVLLGSAPLLVQQGLSESLAGRFEVLHLPHWSYREMHDAFGFSLQEYLCFGGYPGAAALVDDPARWRRYILDSLVETTLSRDVLLLTRVDKPALLRRLFSLGCQYAGQVLSYTKLMGQLQDAGNTTTLAHYLDLLTSAGLLTGIGKYSGSEVRRRGSSPKFVPFNNALLTAALGLDPKDLLDDPALRGRFVESAVGAHLLNGSISGEYEVYYWREGQREVDFVVRRGGVVVAIEVKSGRVRDPLPGMAAFVTRFAPTRMLLVGEGGVPLDEFLDRPVPTWLS